MGIADIPPIVQQFILKNIGKQVGLNALVKANKEGLGVSDDVRKDLLANDIEQNKLDTVAAKKKQKTQMQTAKMTIKQITNKIETKPMDKEQLKKALAALNDAEEKKHSGIIPPSFSV
jgi:predicted NodU family carbamoyl transferase